MLLDDDTIRIVSLAMTQTEILSKEVFLVEKLSFENRETMLHLKCVCFLRPTEDNIALLQQELRNPKYSEYHLFFSNVITRAQLQELAEVDLRETVHQVQEYFADFHVHSPHLFSLGMPVTPSGPTPDSWSPAGLRRVCDGLFSVLCAVKRRPVIRYAGRSMRARALAEEMRARLAKESDLMGDIESQYEPRGTPPVLLILDRRDDPVTPLLSQWTYEAMVHELLGIEANVVDMANVPGIRDEMKKIVLNPEQDEFYRSALYQNFGDLGESLKALLDSFSRENASNRQIATLEDMRKFIEDYPAFRALQGSVSKHVALTSEISRLIGQRNLMVLSELEQNMSCESSHAKHVRELHACIADHANQVDDLFRLVLIYALRYETTSNELASLLEELLARGLSHDKARMITLITSYAGASVRGGDLFKNKSAITSIFRRLQRSAVVVESVFAQHTTLLQELITALLDGKLSDKDADYPFASGAASRERPVDVLVFFVGGATYEEAAYCAKVNAEGTRMVLGSTWMHNSASFIDEVAATMSGAATGPAVSVTTARGVQAKYGAGRAEAGPAHA